MHSIARLAAGLFAAGTLSAATITYTNNTPFGVPDNTPAGVNSDIVVGDPGTITGLSMTITLNPTHTWVGDLIITLTNGTVTATILQRPGKSVLASGAGDSSNMNGTYRFIDTGADLAAALIPLDTNGVLAPGDYRASSNIFSGDVNTTNPFVDLNALFAGQPTSGTWTLNVSDNAGGDITTVTSWSLSLTTDDGGAVPEPSTFALVGLGLLGVGFAARKRR